MNEVTNNTIKSDSTKVINYVYHLIEAGYKVLPKKGKEPFRIKEGQVSKLREHPINHINAPFYFEDAETEGTGVAVFTGDHLECIDFEGPFIASGLYQELHDYIKYTYPDIYDNIVIEHTAKGNPHWYIKCVHTAGRKKLALREPTEQERTKGDKVILLIESLGENNQVNVYPTPGYTQIKGDLLGIEYITPEQRAILHAICSSYSQIIERDIPGINKKHHSDPKAVWNVFNEKHGYDWIVDTLKDIGWTIGREGASRTSVKRPGSSTSKTSGSILKDNNLLYLFSTSTEFPAETPLSPFDIVRYLKYDGDFVQCATALSEQGYGEFNNTIEISFFDVKKTKKAQALSLNRVRFIDYLHSQGIGLFFADDKTYIYTQLTGWTFEEITVEQIKKNVQKHINELPESFNCGITRLELLEFIYKGSDTYFGKSFLEFINRFTPDYLSDTKGAAYIPFINGVVCVTAERMELKTYDQVGKHLWKDSIIDFEITLDNYDITASVWYKFLACICGSDNHKTMTPEQTEKVFYLMSLTGYLLHKYKDPAKPYCVILAEQTETEEKGGGTGKGLFARGIGHLASICTIAGKTFDPLSRFAWQRLQLHNTIAVVDDVPKKFPFDGLYNVITEGVTLERKNQQEIFIPYETSPKIIVISNYVISGAGNHAERRQRVFEFMPFFSPKYTPEQHFGHILFDDWVRDEWNRFYGLMLSCIMLYLKNGIPVVERSEVLKQREIVQKYSKEFSTWFFDEYLKNGCGNWRSTTQLHTEFLEFAGIEKAEYSQKKFMTAILSACCLFGHHRQDDRQTVDGKKVSGFWIEKKTDRIK